MGQQTVLRAFRYPLDPTPRQSEELLRYAGASRWAYNWALAKKMASHGAYRERLAELAASGLDETAAKEALRREAKAARDADAHVEAERHALFNATKRRRNDELGAVDDRIAILQAEQAEARREAEAGGDGAEKARKKAEAAAAEIQILRDLTAPDEHGHAPRTVGDLKKLLAFRRTRRDQMKAERFARGYEIPGGMDLAAQWRTTRDLPREDGGSPWWQEVNTYCFTEGFSRADAAWKNWMDSIQGKRAGRKVGYPTFKKKGVAADSFALYHDAKIPGIRAESDATNRYHTTKTSSVTSNRHRGITLPKLGNVRVKASTRRLVRAVRRGGVIKSVTVTRAADRWYASVLCEVIQDIPDKPTKAQAAQGTIAVKWGTKQVTLLGADGITEIPQPRYLERDLEKLRVAQRRASKATKGSNNRAKRNRRVARLHHGIALRRQGFLHQLSARLAKAAAVVAVEHTDVVDMLRNDRGPRKRGGKKAALNRAVIDAAPGTLMELLRYKTLWNGSALAVTEPGLPTTRTCAKCGGQNPSPTPHGQVFHCGNCKASAPRHVNAAGVIARFATVPAPRQAAAPDRGEAQNARGVPVRPTPSGGGHGTANREDPHGGSP